MSYRVVRSSQSFIFPIHLAEELIPSAIFYATVTPIIGWLLIKQTIIDPMRAERKRKEMEKTKQINRNRLSEKQKEAETAIELLSATYERICREEESKGGLIILNATYGNLENLANIGKKENEITKIG